MWLVINSKAASDLGVPVVGVGLCYQQGYFRQVIDNGRSAKQPLPVQRPRTVGRARRCADRNGAAGCGWKSRLPVIRCRLRAWQVQVGRVTLYLLDRQRCGELPPHRGITSELYGAGPELRLKQRTASWDWRWRLLRDAGHQTEVCHLNEGMQPSLFWSVARNSMEETGQNFEAALASTERENLPFTTPHGSGPPALDRFNSCSHRTIPRQGTRRGNSA